MKTQKWLLFFVALGLIAGTAGLLVRLKNDPRLGQPGVKATPIPGTLKTTLDLPERVLDFTSTNVPEPQIALDLLPPDTSYAERLYTAPDGFWIQNTLVLMGADRTSIHKPDYCLPGKGWVIREKSVVNIPVAGPQGYQLPVAKWLLSQSIQTPDGQKRQVSGFYVFWFVADQQQTPEHFEMVKRLALNLLRTRVMQRWAYVSYFAVCEPGQEDATFSRVAKMIAASVPEFQPPPGGR